jgi:lipoprotein-anchoring transpeptidase ErfK/SrfK
VQAYTKYRAEQKRPRRRNRGAVVFLAFALGLGGAWLTWNRQSVQGFESNAPAEKAGGSGISTTLVTRTLAPANVSSRAEAVGLTNSSTNIARPGTNLSARAAGILEAQIALDRLAVSPGSIDGVPGSQTRAAIRAFQLREGLPVTGELDTNTRTRLPWQSATVSTYRVELTDLDRLLPLSSTWLGKSEQPRLDYESVLELVAERSHAHPKLIRQLNPGLNWDSISPGTVLNVPSIERIRPEAKAAFVRIRLADRTLQAFDADERLLAHFPCSIAARVEKRPVGELSVTVVVPNPDYLFNPENFPESAEAQELGRKLRLNPGPNNPVGTAWIGLNLPGYGIHGTPKPEDVGRTESHGCFRLANWNAEYLLQLVTVGTPVRIEP